MTDLRAYERGLLSRIDIFGEAMALGIEFTGGIKQDGWAPCKGLPRNGDTLGDDNQDSRPSAAIKCKDVPGSGELGQYTDHGRGEQANGFFEWTGRLMGCDFQDSRRHFAEKYNFPLPTNGKPATNGKPSRREKGKPSIFTNSDERLPGFAEKWAASKRGIDAKQVLRASPRAGKFINQYVLCFKSYAADWSTETGEILYRIDGQDFEAYKDLPQRKAHLVRGSKNGLIRVCSPAEWQAAHTVWKCEGLPDAIALAAILPAGQVACTTTHGAKAFDADLAKAFSGKRLHIVPDTDETGEAGAKIVASHCLPPLAGGVKIIPLPYEITPKHGKDLRDYINDGNQFGNLQAIVDHEEFLRSEDVAGASGHQFNWLTTAQLLAADYRPEWLVKNFLVSKQPGLIGGRSKTLKTTMIAELAVSVGSGTKFLGKFETTKKRVAVLSGESGSFTIQETARRVIQARSIAAEDVDVLWDFELPTLTSEDDVKATIANIRENKIDVFIVDPIYLCLLGEETEQVNAGNVFTMGRLLKRVASIGRETGATLLLVHHFRKNSPRETYTPPDIDEFAQSGFTEFARQWLLLGRREEYANNGEHRLWMVNGGSVGFSGTRGLDIDEGELQDDFSGRKWEVEVLTREEAEQTRKAKSAESKQEREAAKKKAETEECADDIRKAFTSLGSDWQIKATVIERTGRAARGKRLTEAWAELAAKHGFSTCQVRKAMDAMYASAGKVDVPKLISELKESEDMLPITKQLRSHLVSNYDLSADATDADARQLAIEKFKSGDLTQKTINELSFGKAPSMKEIVGAAGGDGAPFILPDPSDPLGSISPLQTQASAIDADESLQQSQASAFQNGGRPGMVITAGRLPGPPGRESQGERPILTPEQRTQLVNAIRKAYSGAINHGDPIIVDGMIESVAPYTASPHEMDWLDSGKQLRQRIFSAFGVNPIIVGEIEGANRAQAAVAEKSFCSNVINPLMMLMSQVLTRWAAPLFAAPDERLRIWFEEASADDREMRLREWQIGLAHGAVDAEEYRRNVLNLAGPAATSPAAKMIAKRLNPYTLRDLTPSTNGKH